MGRGFQKCTLVIVNKGREIQNCIRWMTKEYQGGEESNFKKKLTSFMNGALRKQGRRLDYSSTAVLQLPGADGDEGLVRDVAEDEQQHLVRTPPDVALIVTRRHLKHRGLLWHYGPWQD